MEDKHNKEFEESKERDRNIINAGITGANSDTVQRYGAGIKEHIVAYEGIDNESGQQLSRSLKKISEYKVDEEHPDTSYRQQAGFAAEAKTAARENAEKAISGDKHTRTQRTDDMDKQSDGKGNAVGGTNDQLYDVAETDVNGTYISGSGRQLKYVGNDADDCYKKLMQKDYDKYRDADAKLEVPADYYDDVKKRLSEEADKVRRQIAKAEADGNTETAEKLKERLERIEKTNKNLKKGRLTNKEAIEARKNPALSTAKDIARVSHRAGLEGAKYGAAIGGGISVITNLVACVNGEKEADEAVKCVAKDTAVSAGTGYVSGFSGSVIKGVMQNSSSQYMRALSKTNLPATMVAVTISVGKTMKRYFDGEITGVECFEELGENGVSMVSGAMFAAAGGAVGAVGGPIGSMIGGAIGGMVGYAVASASYGLLLDSLKEARLAEEERIRIEEECRQYVELIRKYRATLQADIEKYLSEYMDVFEEAFDGIKECLMIGDVDGFISSANRITKALGKEPVINNKEELNGLIKSEKPISF